MDRYEEALERAKKGLPIDEVFPELKESEDERIRKELIGYLTHRAEVTGFIDEDKDCKRWIAYLEKQKEQRAVLPGDEDDEDILNDPVFLKGFDLGREVQKIFDEPKQEWSEEDEKMFKWISVRIQEHHMSLEYTKQVRNALAWLKSLRPQPHWKPSEEQMEALNAVANEGVLLDLFNDLLKLL